MTNAYSSILAYRDDDWQEYLDNMMLYDIFEDVIIAYPNKQTLKCVIRYILYAYSIESDQVHIGVDWEENKKRIYEFVFAPQSKDLVDQLVYLQHPSVTKTIHKWLEWQESAKSPSPSCRCILAYNKKK